jgi:hypothetical protein
MDRGRVLYWLAGAAAVAGVVGAALIPFGQELTCVEFAGCHTDNTTTRIAVALLGFIVSAILLTIATAGKNRWKRDARCWKPTDSV